jgi:hypothetical protein
MREATRRRARRGMSLTFPAGFVELTTRNEPRHTFWETQLAAYYPDLSRETRSKVLSHLDSQNLLERLGGLGDHLRVAAGLVLDGQDLRGVVLLSVTAVATNEGWSARDLGKGLEAAARSRPSMRLRPLPCTGGLAILVERDGPRGKQTDVFLADHAQNAIVIVSAFVESTAPVDVLPTLTEVVRSYRPG